MKNKLQSLIDHDIILEEVKRMIKEGDEFSGEDFNGQDPLSKPPAELTLSNAISEYCNQTGKQLYKDSFENIITGILNDFDSTEKIEQLRRFVTSITNSMVHLREPKDEDELAAENVPEEDSVDEIQELPDEDDDELDAMEKVKEKPEL
jgi:hypothetical protein